LSARKKLNSIYCSFAALASLGLGIVTGSLVVFAISFAAITAVLIHDGSIRPDRRRR